MIEHLSLLSAFLLGFFGSTHCLGMCGGIVSSLNLNKHNSLLLNLCYHTGRITTYSLLGILFGLLGAGLSNIGALILPLRLLAGIMLILMGFYLMGKTIGLIWLEKAGSQLWRFISPLGSRFIPVKNPLQGLVLGMIWGFLPCGLVYSTLTLALSTTSVSGAGLTMLFFGLGTLPLLLSLSLLQAQALKLKQNKTLRLGAGITITLFGAWSILVLFSNTTHI
jgi:uncharacterized protein